MALTQSQRDSVSIAALVMLSAIFQAVVTWESAVVELLSLVGLAIITAIGMVVALSLLNESWDSKIDGVMR